jgi:hypothetical protein
MFKAIRRILFLTLLFSAQSLAAGFYAGQLTPESINKLPDGGLDAIGGIGDWFLSDGDLCAIVSGKGHATYLSLEGGALVDLWHCNLANDQWSVIHTQLNLQKNQLPPIGVISAGFNNEQAWVETEGEQNGLKTTIRHQFSANTPGQLERITKITRTDAGPRLSMVGVNVLHPRASLIPFSVNTRDKTASAGFSLPIVDTTSFSSILSSVTTTDLQVLLGSRHITPTISYGVHAPRAQRLDTQDRATPLQSFMLNSREFTMHGFFTGSFPSFWAQTPGLLSFGIGQLFDLDTGEKIHLQQSIEVSRISDVAAFTDKVFDGDIYSGKIDAGSAGITVLGAEGTPLTYVRSDSGGNFSFRLPEGVLDYQLIVETPWGESHFRNKISTGSQIGTLVTDTPAVLELPEGEAMRLFFLSENAATIFYSELAPLLIGGKRELMGPESYQLSLSGTPGDLERVYLPAGEYRVLASRGPEFSVSETQISLEPGKTSQLDIDAPRREVETPGLIGVDFHVHSGVSFDSSLPPRLRIADFIAQGGEVIVPTEHNIAYDLNPVIVEMGLENALVSFPGVEITGMAQSAIAPSTIGHSNVFPIEVDPNAFMKGSLQFEGKRLGHVIDAYKERFPNSIFQLNHPRTEAYDDDITFFNHLSQGVAFDPEQAVNEGSNALLVEELEGSSFRDIDFDAIELLNGESMDVYEIVRADWFALLRQNIYKVATANSDSHVSSQIVAYPRSYVEVENDDTASIEISDIVQATRRGALYGSTGPIIKVRLGDTGPGGTYSGEKGMLTITLDQAPWGTADEARIWINGELWKSQPISTANALNIEINVTEDSFIFVEVSGKPSATYSTLLPGFRPFAFANPIFIDSNSNGWKFNEASL